MQEILYDQDYQDESSVSKKSGKQLKSRDLELQHLVKFIEIITAWKVSKYRVISGPYFPVFSSNTGK